MTDLSIPSIDALVAQLSQAITTRLIPLDVALWDAGQIGAYLGVASGTVLEHYACRPDFPRAIPLPPTGEAKRGQRRWKAAEVIEWAEARQERKRA